MSMPADSTLVVFSKFPQPGISKTRLIPTLGEDGAARLAEAFLKDMTLRLAKDIPLNVQLILSYAPPDAREKFKTLLADPPVVLERFSLLAQARGNLGERLAAATQRVRSKCAGPLSFIGTDAPDLPIDVIETGFQHARQGKAYMKGAYDGGYVLLSLPSHALHTVFDEIEWSSPETGKQQTARLRAMGISTIVSNSRWWDVDEPQDLDALRERLERNPYIAPLTLRLLRSL